MRTSVMKGLLALAIGTLACNSGEVAGLRTEGSSTTGAPTTVGSVVITPPASTDLIVGQSVNLIAAVKSTANQNISDQVITWTSSDPSVASISATGALSALKIGTTLITGSSSGKSASLTINVKAAPVGTVAVTVTGSLIVGQSASASAVVTDAAGAALTNRTPAWSSRNPGTAIVSPSGVVTGISSGSTVIDAIVDGVQGSANIFVAPAAISNVGVSLTRYGASIGQQSQAAAIVTDVNGTQITDKLITWSSSNPGVATVTQGGLITAVGNGSTTITAASEGLSGTALFTVANPAPNPVATVNLAILNPRPAVGATTQISATLHDASGAVLNRPINWSTSNSSVATVSATGLVTAIGFGTAIITAASENALSTVTIQIIPPPVSSVTVSAPPATLQPTQTTQLSVVLKDGSGTTLTNRVISYSSANPGVASVTPSGLVTAVARGSIVITVASEGVTNTVTITIPPVAVVNVSAAAGTLQPNATTQVSATLLDGSGAPTINRVITWTSSNNAVATVSATGTVTGVNQGTANIVATSEGVTGSATIVVPTLTNISVSAAGAGALQPGQTTQGIATLFDNNGTPMTNRVITWTSATPSVATVSATGLISAVSIGSSVITATSGSISATLTATVPAVSTVTVAAPVTTMLIGATAQAAATLLDANSIPATNRAIVWSSSAPTIATVSSTGLVTAVGAGSTTISAVSEGKSGVLTFTVSAGGGGTLSVTNSQSTLLVTDQTQLFATLTNSLGGVVTNPPLVWTSSDSVRAPVSQTGVVRQAVGGSQKNITITARSGTVTATSVIQLVGHPPERIAALPAQFMNTALPPAPDAGGVVISVASGGNLQAAINAANLGDVIEIANGAVFTGNFTLPNKGAGTKWITIRPANMSGVPAPGSRMTPTRAAAANLPRIQSPNNNNAILTAQGAHHYRIIGLEVTTSATVTQNYGLVALDGLFGQTSLAQVPHNIVLDRMYIHGNATIVLRRCVLLNSAMSAVIDSDLRECHDDGSDSQAIAGYNGPGPFKIVNNYLEGAGENVIFGGSDPSITNLVPSDIEIRRNHFYKPASWKGSRWVVKNHLELKNSARVLIEGNIFENNWGGGQDGTSIVMKSVNQNNTCPWCGTRDVTMRYNIIRNVGSGFNLAGSPDGLNTTVHAIRMTIHDNYLTAINTGIFTGAARAFVMNGDPADILLAHNTVLSAGTMNGSYVFGPFGSATIRWIARDNLTDGGGNGLFGDNFGGGTAFNRYAPGGAFVGNIMVYGFPTGYPAGNFIVQHYGLVGFANAAALQFDLSPSSTFKNAGTDGRDPGANLSAVASATAGVIVP